MEDEGFVDNPIWNIAVKQCLDMLLRDAAELLCPSTLG